MGCYDNVLVHCPKCGKESWEQSKGGDCILNGYTLENCPDDVLSDVNRHAPFECSIEARTGNGELIPELCGGCGTFFAVDEKTRKEIICEPIPEGERYAGAYDQRKYIRESLERSLNDNAGVWEELGGEG